MIPETLLATAKTVVSLLARNSAEALGQKAGELAIHLGSAVREKINRLLQSKPAVAEAAAAVEAHPENIQNKDRLGELLSRSMSEDASFARSIEAAIAPIIAAGDVSDGQSISIPGNVGGDLKIVRDVYGSVNQ